MKFLRLIPLFLLCGFSQNPGPALTGALAGASGGGGGSTATYVAANSSESGSATCTVTLNVTAGQQVVIAAFSSSGSSMTFTPTDSDLSGITLAATSGASGYSGTTISIYTASVATTRSPTSVSVAASSGANYLVCMIMSFTKGSAFVFDQTSTAANNLVNPFTTGASPTTSVGIEELVACFMSPSSGFSFGSGTGFTMPSALNWSSGGLSAACEYEPVTSVGSYTGTAFQGAVLRGTGTIVTLE